MKADKTLEVLKKYTNGNSFHSKILTLKQNIYLTNQIESVKIYDKIAFIKKR